ncbi:MAG: hypothetical protein ACHQO8_08950, partial [Vicinamibacterales bacterium]
MRRIAPVVVAALALASLRLLAAQAWITAPEAVAPGIQYFTSTDRSLVDDAGPVAIYLLKLDPRRVRLTDTLAKGEILGMDTVDAIAARHHALAAINGGFFNRANGEPVGTLKVNGELVSDYPVVRGVVLIKSPAIGTTSLDFDHVGVMMTAPFTVGWRTWRVPLDGVDTTR